MIDLNSLLSKHIETVTRKNDVAPDFSGEIQNLQENIVNVLVTGLGQTAKPEFVKYLSTQTAEDVLKLLRRKAPKSVTSDLPTLDFTGVNDAASACRLALAQAPFFSKAELEKILSSKFAEKEVTAALGVLRNTGEVSTVGNGRATVYCLREKRAEAYEHFAK